MQDPFARKISYIRVSVTDRCDLRCHYCMAENMTFLPRKDLLTLEELGRVCSAFVSKGVEKIRITGGEPLVRRNIMTLFHKLSRHLDDGSLRELTLTSNGTQLTRFADELVDCGVKRINVSLDTLNAERFAEITRRGNLETVLAGLAAAKKAGLKIKINTVAQQGLPDSEIHDLIAWCGDEGFDITFIETMPLGEIGGDRRDEYLPVSDLRPRIEEKWSLIPSAHTTGGPSKYHQVKETGQRIGFITPLSEHFCATCNRVRITATGKLYMCLGQDDHADLITPMRSFPNDDRALHATIDEAIGRKPKGHEFVIDDSTGAPALQRHMSVTGG